MLVKIVKMKDSGSIMWYKVEDFEKGVYWVEGKDLLISGKRCLVFVEFKLLHTLRRCLGCNSRCQKVGVSVQEK
jgi:hypothetical protein